jgi:hypothetical protein
MQVFIARNHNETIIGWNIDIGNLMEDAMVYEEVTGNRVSISAEPIENVPERYRSKVLDKATV